MGYILTQANANSSPIRKKATIKPSKHSKSTTSYSDCPRQCALIKPRCAMSESRFESKYSIRKSSDYSSASKSSADRQKSRTYSSLSIGSNATSAMKMDSRPAIVIEVGNRLTRIGFSGEFTPREMFETKYVDPLNPVPQAVFDPNYTDKEQHLMLVKFFRDIIFRKLLTTINARRVVIVESLLTPTKIRNAIAKAFLNVLLWLHIRYFDIATKETVLFPIADGILMLNSFQSTPLCTSTVEEISGGYCLNMPRFVPLTDQLSGNSASQTWTSSKNTKW
uniref:Actin-related protein 10 n=1 Tax=Ditylenchus dipsaci TaxID=166011 RepID=A0A915DEI1_9BILA